MDDDEAVTHGVWRRVFDDCVTFQPDWLRGNDDVDCWDYAVFKFPFVPGFHVCKIYDDGSPEGVGDWEEILSTHKTLHEAMGVLKILLASGGVQYV